jgi:phytoene/squalene synthetase
VSRTFALNIRLLRGPLGDAVRVGYLMCRAADTLEDSWPGSQSRSKDHKTGQRHKETRPSHRLVIGAGFSFVQMPLFR